MGEPQLPGVTFTFLYYFSLTTLIVLLLTCQGLGMGWETRLPYQIGISFGLTAGLWGAYFNRSVTVTLCSANQGSLRQKIEQILTQQGFTTQSQLDDYTVYGRSGWQSWLTGKILVKTQAKQVILRGRSKDIKRLQTLLT